MGLTARARSTLALARGLGRSTVAVASRRAFPQADGVLRDGFYTRYIKLGTRQVRAFEPTVEILPEFTSEAVRNLARKLRA